MGGLRTLCYAPLFCFYFSTFPSSLPSTQVEGDLFLGDLGHGLPLRPGAFDGAISISAVQWLCNADRAGHDPR